MYERSSNSSRPITETEARVTNVPYHGELLVFPDRLLYMQAESLEYTQNAMMNLRILSAAHAIFSVASFIPISTA